jgi:hypothetical protein
VGRPVIVGRSAVMLKLLLVLGFRPFPTCRSVS